MRKFLMLAVALMPVLAFGEVPMVLGYQGRLLKSDGTPQTGTKSIIFSIYADPTVGDVLWTETQSLAITNGFVSTFVGAMTAISPTLFTGKDLYLGVTVDGVELRPRQRIGSVGYAVKALNADNATNAGHATSADTAGSAGTAGTATNVNGGTVSASAVTATGDITASGRIAIGVYPKVCASGGNAIADCYCDAGDILIGGGARANSNNNLGESWPTANYTAWRASCTNSSGTRVACVELYVFCLRHGQ